MIGSTSLVGGKKAAVDSGDESRNAWSTVMTVY